jgi:hypothetical protein
VFSVRTDVDGNCYPLPGLSLCTCFVLGCGTMAFVCPTSEAQLQYLLVEVFYFMYFLFLELADRMNAL